MSFSWEEDDVKTLVFRESSWGGGEEDRTCIRESRHAVRNR